MSRTHSICVSNWNSIHTVKPWAESLLANLSDDEEVIIVDGKSRDGSERFLEDFCRENGFRFISAATNIGQARQLAFEEAAGRYIISQVDTDDLIVSLQEVLRLYHEVVERDPITGMHRAFRCGGVFIIPRFLLGEVGGYPDLHYYEDQLVAFSLAQRGQLTASWKVSAVISGIDPKKRSLPYRFRYSFRRIRDGLRLGMFEPRNPQGVLLFPPAWIASRFMKRYDFRRDWWNLDVHRDRVILPWIERNRLSHRLLR